MAASFSSTLCCCRSNSPNLRPVVVQDPEQRRIDPRIPVLRTVRKELDDENGAVGDPYEQDIARTARAEVQMVQSPGVERLVVLAGATTLYVAAQIWRQVAALADQLLQREVIRRVLADALTLELARLMHDSRPTRHTSPLRV